MTGTSLVLVETAVGSGSGIVWDEDGTVVTNHHVIASSNDLRRIASGITVTLSNNKTYNAEYIDSSVRQDIAILKVAASEWELDPIRRGRSFDLQKGQRVYTLGRIYGCPLIIRRGRVEDSFSQVTVDSIFHDDVICHSASTKKGMSGGPMIDSEGAMVGMNSIGNDKGNSFAVPIERIKSFVARSRSNDYCWDECPADLSDNCSDFSCDFSFSDSSYGSSDDFSSLCSDPTLDGFSIVSSSPDQNSTIGASVRFVF